jgi:hypothetical protein
MFDDFYFAREPLNKSELLTSDLTIPQIRDKDVTVINKENHLYKDNTYHSSKVINREESIIQKPKKLKKTKSKTRINELLVERARRRPDKSVKK